MIRARSPTVARKAVKLVQQMLGERGRGILDPVEIEGFLAAARRHDVGEAVGLERFAGPVDVERAVVVGLPEDQIVGAGIVRRLVAVDVVRGEIAGAAAHRGSSDRRFEQRVLRQLLGDEGVELEIAELQAA